MFNPLPCWCHCLSFPIKYRNLIFLSIALIYVSFLWLIHHHQDFFWGLFILVTITVLALASLVVTSYFMVLKPGKRSCALILEYCSQVEIKLTPTCPADTQMQMRLPDFLSFFLFFFFLNIITCRQTQYFIFCLQDPPVLFTVSWKSINEILLNSIFAPYGFAEAVAALKQSAVPSGHCGFCPSPVCAPLCFHLLPQHAALVRE